MSSSEGEDFLNSADVNEEFSFDEDGEQYGDQEYDIETEDAEDSEENDRLEQQKYAEELEYEDIGEPATFNFNIHNGT